MKSIKLKIEIRCLLDPIFQVYGVRKVWLSICTES